MKIPSVLKTAQHFLDENSPVILTGMALAGLGGSVYLAAKGAFKASQKLSEESPHLGNSEKFLLTYKFYAPAAALMVGTGACMVMATKIGLNRTAALGAALVVTERANDQYRDKVKEILGENKATKIQDAVAQDQVAKIPTTSLVPAREGEQTFIDGWSGRSFSSTMEGVKKCLNEFNHSLMYGDYASLTDFYDLLGLDSTTESDRIGWNSKQLLGLSFTSVLKDDKAVVYFDFATKPKHDFRDGNV